jgi:hypothetical protein
VSNIMLSSKECSEKYILTPPPSCPGSQYIHTMQQYPSTPPSEPHLHHETSGVVSRARALWQNLGKHVMTSGQHKSEVNKDAHKVSGREHMQCVDYFDGGMTRRSGEPERGRPEPSRNAVDHDRGMDLFEIRPEVDGRLMDVRRAANTSR